MKAVILVGGEGTRLRPLTCNMPKPMVPVLNKPFLEHVINHLSSYAVKEIVLAMGYLSPVIHDYFGDGNRLGVGLFYSIESEPLGTGGAIKNAEKFLDEPFLVLNGDVFTDLDVAAMYRFHREKRAKITIARMPVEDFTSYGVIETDAQGKIIRFLEKPSPGTVNSSMINAGTYVIEPEILSLITPNVKFSIEHELFVKLSDYQIPAYGFDYHNYWIDMGTVEKYLQLHVDLLTGKSSQYISGKSEQVTVGKGSKIHPTALVKGPVLIGSRCTVGENVQIVGPVTIGSNCTIGRDTFIESSVIWNNVKLGNGVVLRKSIVADDSCLDDNCNIESSALGNNVTVVSSCKLEPSSKIWPGKIVDAHG